MYALGSYALGMFLPSEAGSITSMKEYYDWRIDWFHRSGGIKRTMFFGMENIPIKSINWEENKKLMGAGDIELSHVDFPIDISDEVNLYYQNDRKWRGLVASRIDPKGGKLKINSRSDLLDKRIFNYTFSSATLETMLQTVIESTSVSDSGVTWNSEYVDIGDSSLYSMKFDYVKSKKAIDDIVKKMNGREWGVDVNNVFNVYTPSTSVSKIIQNCEDQWYSELSNKVDDSRIKATRYQVFVKSTTAGQSIRVGEVGYNIAGSTFAILSVENITERKDDKFIISANVTTTFALTMAYQDLQNQSELSTQVTLKDFRIDKYNPAIGTYIKCVDAPELVLKTLINCDTDTGWNNATLYSDDYVEGTGAIQILVSVPSEEVYYDFGEIKRYDYIEKIVLMARSEEDIGEVLQMGVSENSSTLFDNPYSIFINDSDLWEMKQIAITEKTFRYLGFRLKTTRDVKRQFMTLGRNAMGEGVAPSEYALFYFDRIQAYTYDRNEYSANVVQKKYKLDKKGLTCDLILGDYDAQSSQELFNMKKEIEQIQEIQQQ